MVYIFYAISAYGLHWFSMATPGSWCEVLLGFVEILIMCLNYLFVSALCVFKITYEWLRERTEHLDIFLFSAHHSVVFYFRCSVYWWKGSARF